LEVLLKQQQTRLLGVEYFVLVPLPVLGNVKQIYLESMCILAYCWIGVLLCFFKEPEVQGMVPIWLSCYHV
jgi:hypothetical protein